MLEAVQQLQLDWCKVLPYKGGKLGGWVLENYLGFFRVSVWFYSTLSIIASDPSLIIPTNREQ